MKPGASLVILDLLQHNVEEVSDSYADRWLGFSEAQLTEMLKDAGFVDIYTDVVDKEIEPPYFETLMAVAWKPA